MLWKFLSMQDVELAAQKKNVEALPKVIRLHGVFFKYSTKYSQADDVSLAGSIYLAEYFKYSKKESHLEDLHCPLLANFSSLYGVNQSPRSCAHPVTQRAGAQDRCLQLVRG